MTLCYTKFGYSFALNIVFVRKIINTITSPYTFNYRHNNIFVCVFDLVSLSNGTLFIDGKVKGKD